MSVPIADDYGSIAARLKELEEGSVLKRPKWQEQVEAYCGPLSMQGGVPMQAGGHAAGNGFKRPSICFICSGAGWVNSRVYGQPGISHVVSVECDNCRNPEGRPPP